MKRHLKLVPREPETLRDLVRTDKALVLMILVLAVAYVVLSFFA